MANGATTTYYSPRGGLDVENAVATAVWWRAVCQAMRRLSSIIIVVTRFSHRNGGNPFGPSFGWHGLMRLAVSFPHRDPAGGVRLALRQPLLGQGRKSMVGVFGD